jgi:chromosome partitioning protein
VIRIAVVTAKGGTGKTTTAINLGHGLALSGRRVLLIDCDPQGNISAAFGVEPKLGLADLLTAGEVGIESLRPGLFLMDSGGQRLAETELFLAGEPRRESRLADALTGLRGSDVVICDCSPSVNLLNLNALAYAEWAIIPVTMDFFAMLGARQTMEMMNQVEKILERPTQTLGILPTFYDQRTRISRQMNESLLGEFGSRMFTTRIRTNVQLREAQAARKTIFEHAPYSSGALDYYLLTKEVLKRLDSHTPVTQSG